MKNEKMPISMIMTKNPITANLSDSLLHVSTLMKKHKIRHLPVLSGEKLVGIVSKTDILRLSFGDMFDAQSTLDETVFNMLKLEQVMIHNPTTVQEEDSILEVAEKFAEAEYHAIPVLDGEKITGIVSTTDLINYLLEHYH
jgi:CBS domain-containing protein